ncbi:hypothetical protein HDU96_000505 [Phlyctochytrium bullatum]|nr:hypothetical protein HDU96_000505 [Phlyctochytrium bullatum]
MAASPFPSTPALGGASSQLAWSSPRSSKQSPALRQTLPRASKRTPGSPSLARLLANDLAEYKREQDRNRFRAQTKARKTSAAKQYTELYDEYQMVASRLKEILVQMKALKTSDETDSNRPDLFKHEELILNAIKVLDPGRRSAFMFALWSDDDFYKELIRQRSLSAETLWKRVVKDVTFEIKSEVGNLRSAYHGTDFLHSIARRLGYEPRNIDVDEVSELYLLSLSEFQKSYTQNAPTLYDVVEELVDSGPKASKSYLTIAGLLCGNFVKAARNTYTFQLTLKYIFIHVWPVMDNCDISVKHYDRSSSYGHNATQVNNYTMTAIAPITYTPQDFSRVAPEKDLRTLTAQDILPSPKDFKLCTEDFRIEIWKACVDLLVQNRQFQRLLDRVLASGSEPQSRKERDNLFVSMLQQHHIHPPRPVTPIKLTPLGLKKKNEMTHEGCIDVLLQFAKELHWKPKHTEASNGEFDGAATASNNAPPMQFGEANGMAVVDCNNVGPVKQDKILVAGDLGSLRIMRGAKSLCADDLVGVEEQLGYIVPVPGKFHYAMNFSDVLLKMFYIDGKNDSRPVPGTLPHYLRKYKHIPTAKAVDYQQRPKVLNELWSIYVGIFFKSGLIAQFPQYDPRAPDMDSDAELQITKEFSDLFEQNEKLQHSSIDGLDGLDNSKRQTLTEYMRLFVWHVNIYHRFARCVRFGDGDAILSLHRVFLPYFRKYKRHNYFQHTVIELIELSAIWDRHTAFISVQNRFTNTQGKKDTFKPIDLAMEHLIKEVKGNVAHDGTNRIFSHTSVLSLSSFTAAKKTQEWLSECGYKAKNVHHQALNVKSDISLVTNEIEQYLEDDRQVFNGDFDLYAELEALMSPSSKGPVTKIIDAVKRGDGDALDFNEGEEANEEAEEPAAGRDYFENDNRMADGYSVGDEQQDELFRDDENVINVETWPLGLDGDIWSLDNVFLAPLSEIDDYTL